MISKDFGFSQFYNLAHKSNVFDNFVIFVGDKLDVIILVVLLIGLFIIGFKRQYDSHKLVCVSCYELFINIVGIAFIARGIAEILKFFIHSARPFIAHPDIVKPLFEIHGIYDSFPSGHATLFFAFSVMIWKYNRALGYVMFILSILICLARIIAGVHYPLDILAGALLGMVVAGVMIRIEKSFHLENPKT